MPSSTQGAHLVLAVALLAVACTGSGDGREEGALAAGHLPDSIPCEGHAVDADCVAWAAARARRTIAWLPGSGGTSDRRLFVAPPPDGVASPVASGGILYETTVDGVDIDLASAPAPSSPGDRSRAGVVRTGDITAEAWRSDDGSSMRLEWRRAGQGYRLEASALPEGDVGNVAGVVEEALAAITFVTPPGD